ncbi:MAG: MoaD/ThiS family protein [Myxococcales bacterium]|nr:MoaD/ThiS family protein [Myxococcales bacterium]
MVVVRYFANLRELRGTSEERCDISSGSTPASLYLALGLPPELPVAYAVNQERVAGTTALCDGDEVVFLPPLGGG